MPLVYDELRALARRALRRRPSCPTLQPTALVHEAYLRLAAQRQQTWSGPAEFVVAATRMIRRSLVNYELARRSAKRGGRHRRVPFEPISLHFEEDVVSALALDELLQRLASFDRRQGVITELRIFGGLAVPRIAELLAVSPRTVDNEWAHARAWLKRELERSRERPSI